MKSFSFCDLKNGVLVPLPPPAARTPLPQGPASGTLPTQVTVPETCASLFPWRCRGRAVCEYLACLEHHILGQRVSPSALRASPLCHTMPGVPRLPNGAASALSAQPRRLCRSLPWQRGRCPAFSLHGGDGLGAIPERRALPCARGGGGGSFPRLPQVPYPAGGLFSSPCSLLCWEPVFPAPKAKKGPAAARVLGQCRGFQGFSADPTPGAAAPGPGSHGGLPQQAHADNEGVWGTQRGRGPPGAPHLGAGVRRGPRLPRPGPALPGARTGAPRAGPGLVPGPIPRGPAPLRAGGARRGPSIKAAAAAVAASRCPPPARPPQPPPPPPWAAPRRSACSSSSPPSCRLPGPAVPVSWGWGGGGAGGLCLHAPPRGPCTGRRGVLRG